MECRSQCDGSSHTVLSSPPPPHERYIPGDGAAADPLSRIGNFITLCALGIFAGLGYLLHRQLNKPFNHPSSMNSDSDIRPSK